MEPKVLLLDEPLGALDLRVRKALQIELKRIQETVGITFVYVTHDQEEALAMSDRVAVMNNGIIEQLAATAGDLRPSGDRIRRTVHRRYQLHRHAGRTRRRAPRTSPAGRRGDGLHATVVTRMIIGATVQWVVRLDDGQEVLARLQRSGRAEAESFGDGDEVFVSWAEGEALELTGGRTT